MGLVSGSSSSCSNSPSALSHLKMHVVVSMLVRCLLSAVSVQVQGEAGCGALACCDGKPAGRVHVPISGLVKWVYPNSSFQKSLLHPPYDYLHTYTCIHTQAHFGGKELARLASFLFSGTKETKSNRVLICKCYMISNLHPQMARSRKSELLLIKFLLSVESALYALYLQQQKKYNQQLY